MSTVVAVAMGASYGLVLLGGIVAWINYRNHRDDNDA